MPPDMASTATCNVTRMDDMPAAAPAPSPLQWWDIPGALGKILRGQARHTIILTELLERTSLMATQDQVDALAAQLATATDGIRADIDKLKADVAAGNELDFSALDARVAALSALDAEN